MKKLTAILITISVLVPASTGVRAAYDAATARDYLEAHNTSPWTVMALSALGVNDIATQHVRSVSATSAIQYAAPILALTSLGHDPRTFGATDYVAALKAYHRDGQIGDARSINDDIFGILALISAGIPATDPAVSDAKSFLLQHQTDSGGWGISPTAGADTNMTAAAILALRAVGIPSDHDSIQKALHYLRQSQNEDGGFPYDPTSAFSRRSDTPSTAWVIWTLNALGIPLEQWNRGNNTPRSFLESRQTAAGYFQYQSGAAEDTFSPITTSYAVIALQGKSLPLRIITPPGQVNEFDFRIEGSQSQICVGKAAGPTPLDMIRSAASSCNFSYHISQTARGPYLDRINTDQAQGQTGWLYLVNYSAPSVGAADYRLQNGDSVLWYFGEAHWQPTRLTLSHTTASMGTAITATVESYSSRTWSALADATTHVGSQTYRTGAEGRVLFSPAGGTYRVTATKENFIRSNVVTVQINAGQNPAAAVNLSVTISQPPPRDTIAFSIEPGNIDFGTLQPGGNAQKNLIVRNTGTVGIRLTGAVSGDAVFRENLTVDALPWQNFTAPLTRSASKVMPVKLSVPANFSSTGQKTGQLTFWATAE